MQTIHEGQQVMLVPNTKEGSISYQIDLIQMRLECLENFICALFNHLDPILSPTSQVNNDPTFSEEPTANIVHSPLSKTLEALASRILTLINSTESILNQLDL